MKQYSFYASNFNSFWNEHSDNDATIEYFVNSNKTRRINRLVLNKRPDDEDFGRRVARALASNAHITEIWLTAASSGDVAVRDVIQWVTSSRAGETPTATLACFTNLEKIIVDQFHRDWSLEDWDLIFPLLLTSTLLKELKIVSFREGQDVRVMSALAQYLGAATRASLRKFDFFTNDSLTEAAFVSLCDGVAGSQLCKLMLGEEVVNKANVEKASESLARAIAESSLEEITIMSSLVHSALLHTLPVQNLDFAISNICTVGSHTRMKINREWKPLLSANVPLALWPQILEKAHASSETSHGPAGILFYILREKPDLVR
jgi:hypothetical protein